MRLKTVVEEYLNAALDLAEGERIEGGAFVARILGFPGIVASGADVHECYDELFRLLEEWVLLSLARGYSLPKLNTPAGPLDLSADANRALATYHADRVAAIRESPGPFFENDAEFDAALEALERRPGDSPAV